VRGGAGARRRGERDAVEEKETRRTAVTRRLFDDVQRKKENDYCVLTLSLRPPRRTPLSSCFCTGRD
jgi:hypothetical protein